MSVLAALVASQADAKQKNKASELASPRYAWAFRYGEGRPPAVRSHKGGGFQFQFPRDPHEIDYLLRPRSAPIRKEITVKYRIVVTSGNPEFLAHRDTRGQPRKPATVAVIVQRKGDDLVMRNGRFWGSIRPELTPGRHTLTIPVKPRFWSNAYGDAARDKRQGWRNTMNHPGNVGFTFGGVAHAGHGVGVRGGSVKMIVDSFKAR